MKNTMLRNMEVGKIKEIHFYLLSMLQMSEQYKQ